MPAYGDKGNRGTYPVLPIPMRGIAFQWHMETMAIAVRTQYSLYLGEGLHSSGGRTISGSDVTSSQLRTAGRDFSGGSRRGRHHPAPAPKRRHGFSRSEERREGKECG